MKSFRNHPLKSNLLYLEIVKALNINIQFNLPKLKMLIIIIKIAYI